MWDNPAALTLVARLILLGTVLFALSMAARQATESWLPFRQVEIQGALQAQTRAAVPQIVGRLQGGFFSLDLKGARLAFEALPWVRSAAVQRIWPGRLIVILEEHVPAAAWNDLAVLNIQGEVFPVRPWAGLPSMHAPEGMEREVAKRFGEFARVLGPGGWRIAALQVDARNAWRLQLQGGVTLDLGRERLLERLGRFVTFYPLAVAQVGAARRVDMRYPNGFAVQAESDRT
jgi:cell division protein FtsQ